MTITSEQAFLLTRHWRDSDQGIELVFWLHSEQGPLRLVVPEQQAVGFIRRQKLLDTTVANERKPLELVDMSNRPVDGLYFRHQRDLVSLAQQLKSSGIEIMESDIKPTDRYLMERFITAAVELNGAAKTRNGYVEITQPQIKPAQYLPHFKYISLDIETDVHSGEILSIAYCGEGIEQVLMQGSSEQWPSNHPIQWYKDERDLLMGFFCHIQRVDPDLIIGWNVINFDLNMIERRCRHYRIPFKLGRGTESATILQPQQSGQLRIASIPGRVALDGIECLRSAFWNFDSFSLNAVATELLGKQKLISSSHNKIDEILRLYREDRPALAAYNLEDCRLVEQIFIKTDLINFVIQRSVMTGLALGRNGGSVAAFDNLYLPHLHRAGVVAHNIGAIEHQENSPGGYVMNSRPGLYQNVLVLDFKSLYPSIIRTFLIDPLGLVKPGDDPVPGFLGAMFSRKQHILPGIITRLWELRDQAKQQQNSAMSQAIKIIMNSFYGVLGSRGCRFYDPKLASSITRRGHQIITQSRDWITTQGFEVIYGDTDSLFVLLGENYDHAQSKVQGKKLAQDLNQWWQHKIENDYSLVSALEIEFETHYSHFLMPTIRGAETGSKKRYAGTLLQDDGSYKLLFKGLESVRSDWTALAKQFQQELYKRVFFKQPYRDYVIGVVQQLKQGDLDSQLIYRKRLRRKLSDYQRNIPPHVQAAKKMKCKPGGWISYVITNNGPEPLDDLTSLIDYEHYIKRQLLPVADSILHFVGDSFETIIADQLDLF